MKTQTNVHRKLATWSMLFVMIFSSMQLSSQKDTTRIEIGSMEFIFTEKIKKMEEGVAKLEKGKETFRKQITNAEERIAEAEQKISELKDSEDEAAKTRIDAQKMIIEQNEKKIAAFESGIEDIDNSIKNIEKEIMNLGQSDTDDTQDNNRRIKVKRKSQYNGHWAGFELGLANFMNTNYGIASESQTDFMNLNPEKSFAFAFNFIEYNLPVSRNFGFTTGMGLSMTHYNLSKNIDLYKDEFGVMQAQEVDPLLRDYDRNKLNMGFLTVPLIAEMQVKAGKNKLFLGAGVTGSMRLWSRHKQKYEIDGRKYKDKVVDDFQLSPFRYGATVRAGYGPIALFVNYDFVPLFKADRGPELYPVSIGLRLINF